MPGEELDINKVYKNKSNNQKNIYLSSDMDVDAGDTVLSIAMDERLEFYYESPGCDVSDISTTLSAQALLDAAAILVDEAADQLNAFVECSDKVGMGYDGGAIAILDHISSQPRLYRNYSDQLRMMSHHKGILEIDYGFDEEDREEMQRQIREMRKDYVEGD